MSHAFESLMVHAQTELKRSAGKSGGGYLLFEWYAAFFPEILNYSPSPASLKSLDPDALEEKRIDALARKKSKYEHYSPQKLLDCMGSLAVRDQTDVLTYIRERWDDEDSPWMAVITSSDLMGFADEPYLSEYCACLERDFSDREGLKANIDALRSTVRVLRRNWLASPPRYTFAKSEVLTFLVWCALMGPGDYAAEFCLGYADEETLMTSTAGSEPARGGARVRIVSFTGRGGRDFTETDSAIDLVSRQTVALGRRPGFRRTSERSCELGIGDGDLEISREHAVLEFDGDTATLTNLSPKPVLVLRGQGGRRLLAQHESCELSNRDVCAFSPAADADGKPAPRLGETAFMYIC